MAERRSTRQRETRGQARTSRDENPLIPIGAVWEDENDKVGVFYKGAIRSVEGEDGTSDISRLKELLDSLEDGQSLNLLLFYNDKADTDKKQPVYRAYVSIYTPGAKGGAKRRGGRR